MKYVCVKEWRRNFVGDVIMDWEYAKLSNTAKANFKAVEDTNVVPVIEEKKTPELPKEKIDVLDNMIKDIKRKRTSDTFGNTLGDVLLKS